MKPTSDGLKETKNLHAHHIIAYILAKDIQGLILKTQSLIEGDPKTFKISDRFPQHQFVLQDFSFHSEFPDKVFLNPSTL